MLATSRARGWRPSRDLPLLVLAIAITLGMRRAPDLDAVTFAAFGTEISLVATDFAFLALAIVIAARLLGRAKLPKPARALTIAAAAFAAWLLVSSAINGAEPLVGAVKLLEYGLLALGLVLFVQQRWQLWIVVALLVAVTIAADVDALYEFAHNPGVRQDAFLGSHELAALGTLMRAYGIATRFSRRAEAQWLGWIALLAGAVAAGLGAALASLLGMYLAFGTVVVLALVRRSFTWPALAVAVAAAAAVTATALSLREGDLGFVESDAPILSAESAGGWSQRVIYAYIGGRVFLANPVFGTGWYGELPPHEFARFVPDARRAFPDQPPKYFPRTDEPFIPQQTYDQILFQLGLLGAVLFLVVAVLAVRTAARVGARWPPGGRSETLAFLPAAWLAAMAGALGGEALFGGIAIATLFWLTLGVVALTPSLVPPDEPARRRPVPEPELAPAVP